MDAKVIKDLVTQGTEASKLINFSLENLKQFVEKDPQVALKVFMSGINYHKHLVSTTKDIINLLKEEYISERINPDILKFLEECKPYLFKKYLKVLHHLDSLDFIPKELPICPNCGTYFGKDCIKEPIIVDKRVIGYTYICKEGVKNGFNTKGKGSGEV